MLVTIITVSIVKHINKIMKQIINIYLHMVINLTTYYLNNKILLLLQYLI